MGWIGILDQTGGRFEPSGLGAHGQTGTQQAGQAGFALMPRGTLMLETRLSPEERPQTLLSFSQSLPWIEEVSLHALPGGAIVLILRQADDISSVTLPYQPDDRTDVIRLSYGWDAPAGWSRLVLERPDSDKVHWLALPRPRPLSLLMLQAMLNNPHCRQMDREVIFVALSSKVEPVGPLPGFCQQVPVLTPRGEVPIGQLRRGDLVETDGVTQVPVLQAIARRVPGYGSFRPVRLRAPYFGLRHDIIVSPQQRLVIRGSEVEYLFGSEAVLVPARHLVNGFSALLADAPPVITYHQLLLPGHEEIIAAGTRTESLYVGRLRRNHDLLAASALAGFDRARLPEHARPVWPVLRAFEAITLAMNRAA
ncbi:MAG: hypothetical protein COW54_14530 [Rhodobacteraceae bacterium CG17_big_fil_post_rev_8_21_14_2_50_63_15]|nr:MAG: hypothetical protein COW54_14530 [Rhodobacteraceae bacterium CG17_big_fil_post_rev_8_21_14_2_50_63_15]